MSERTPAGEHDSGLLSLITVARFHQLNADAAQLAHEFGTADSALDDRGLVRAAGWLGLKARCISSAYARLQHTPLPGIVSWRDGRYAVLAGAGAEQVLIKHSDRPLAETMSRQDFAALWSGRLILVARRKAGVTGAGEAFGFRWLLPFVLKYRRHLAEVLIASFFIQLLALAAPLFFQVVIDKVLAHRGLTTLDVLAVGLLAVSLFEVMLGGLRTYVFAHTTNRIDVTLGATLFRHLLQLPLAYFAVRRVGDTVARVRELETVRSFITGSAITVTVDIAFTCIFFAVMLLYSRTLTLLVAATLPPYALLAWLAAPALRARLNEKFDRGADNQAYLVEAVTTIETIKATAVEPAMQRDWEERLAGYVGASFRTTILANLANQAAALVNRVMVVGVLWLGAHQVINGQLSVGQLVAFNLFAARVAAPILRLVQLWQEFLQAGVALRRLGDIFDAAPERSYRDRPGARPRLRGAIEFDDVYFRYHPGTSDVLRGLSLRLSPGTTLGIVGGSGCGKSTVARLLQRLYVPERGQIRIDGIDLALIDPTSLRRQLVVVGQENALFDRTVRENIALVRPTMALAAVVRAAQLAGAHDFILSLPDGYDTVVGERGTSLSGGQRQRIAIARALAADPSILVFDEATSALDYEAENLVQRNMRAICAGRTVIVIAHRLSALRIADCIAVIAAGQVAELGTHAELVKAGGYYAGLCRRQRNADGATA